MTMRSTPRSVSYVIGGAFLIAGIPALLIILSDLVDGKLSPVSFVTLALMLPAFGVPLAVRFVRWFVTSQWAWAVAVAVAGVLIKANS